MLNASFFFFGKSSLISIINSDFAGDLFYIVVYQTNALLFSSLVCEAVFLVADFPLS